MSPLFPYLAMTPFMILIAGSVIADAIKQNGQKQARLDILLARPEEQEAFIRELGWSRQSEGTQFAVWVHPQFGLADRPIDAIVTMLRMKLSLDEISKFEQKHK